MISVKFSTLFWCQNWFKANLSAGFAGEFVFAFNQIEQILVTFLSVFCFFYGFWQWVCFCFQSFFGFYGFWCRVCFCPVFNQIEQISVTFLSVFSSFECNRDWNVSRIFSQLSKKPEFQNVRYIRVYKQIGQNIFHSGNLTKLGSSRPFGIQWDTGLCLQHSACQKFLTNPRMHPHRGISMFDC